MDIAHTIEGGVVYADGLRLASHKNPLRDPVVVVPPRDHILPVDLLSPPAQHGHAILDRPHRHLLCLPALHQRINVLGFQRLRVHTLKAQRL